MMGMDEAQALIDDLFGQIAVLAKRVASAEENTKAVWSQHALAVEQRDELASQCNGLRASAVEIRQRTSAGVDGLKDRLASAVRVMESRGADIVELRAQVFALEANLMAADGRADAAVKVLNARAADLMVVCAERDTMRAERDALAERSTEREHGEDGPWVRLAKRTAEVAGLRTEVADLETALQSSHDMYCEHASQIDKLKVAVLSTRKALNEQIDIGPDPLRGNTGVYVQEDMPTPNTPEVTTSKGTGPDIWGIVIEDMAERNRLGAAKYGQPLRAHDGRNSLVDAYQESLDMTVYLRKAIAERE